MLLCACLRPRNCFIPYLSTLGVSAKKNGKPYQIQRPPRRPPPAAEEEARTTTTARIDSGTTTMPMTLSVKRGRRGDKVDRLLLLFRLRVCRPPPLDPPTAAATLCSTDRKEVFWAPKASSAFQSTKDAARKSFKSVLASLLNLIIKRKLKTSFFVTTHAALVLKQISLFRCCYCLSSTDRLRSKRKVHCRSCLSNAY